ncbi:hypothetical protein NPIL_696331 [Nephila pilipes]|uniref:Uncharacterized protein n=1 Tax=Nephila pilipes TaxID=299642 RepID=A0A8X6IW07_NEPPI|nr:hypothetical protein NPIL_696331 [Nephila pilipes]
MKTCCTSHLQACNQCVRFQIQDELALLQALLCIVTYIWGLLYSAPTERLQTWFHPKITEMPQWLKSCFIMSVHIKHIQNEVHTI